MDLYKEETSLRKSLAAAREALDHLDQDIEAFIDAANEKVEDMQSEIDGKDERIGSLEKELADLNDGS